MEKNKLIYEELKKIQKATGDTQDGFKLQLRKLGYGFRNECIIFSYDNGKIIYKIPLDCLDEIVKKFSHSYPKNTKIPEYKIPKQSPVSQMPSPDYLDSTPDIYINNIKEHFQDTLDNLEEAKKSGISDMIEFYEKKVKLEKESLYGQNEKSIRENWIRQHQSALDYKEFDKYKMKYPDKSYWLKLESFHLAEFLGLLDTDINEIELDDLDYIIKQGNGLLNFDGFVSQTRNKYPEYFRKDGFLNSKAKNQNFPPDEIRIILRNKNAYYSHYEKCMIFNENKLENYFKIVKDNLINEISLLTNDIKNQRKVA